MRKKIKTPNQKEWEKGIRRIKQFMRRAKKRGYIFDENIIPDKPDIITRKKLDELNRLNPRALYKRGFYYNSETNEQISGVEGRKIERKRASIKAFKTRYGGTSKISTESFNVLQTIRIEISTWTPRHNWSGYHTAIKYNNKNMLDNLLNEVIREEGEYEVAKRLQSDATRVLDLCTSILYDSDQEQSEQNFVRFATIIKGRSLNHEEAEQYSEMMEYIEL